MSATVLTFSTTLCIGIHVTPQASSCRSVVGDVAQGMYIRMLCTCAACTWRAFPSGREGGADGAEVVFPRRTASFYPITYIRTRLCVRSYVSVSAHEIAGAQDVCVCVCTAATVRCSVFHVEHVPIRNTRMCVCILACVRVFVCILATCRHKRVLSPRN